MATKTTKSLIPKSKAKNAFDLLSDICRLIRAQPLRYNQHWWLFRRGRDNGLLRDDPPNGYPSCGTVGCVAGWVVTLKRQRVPSASVLSTVAARILRLDVDQERALFDGSVGDDPQTLAHALNGIAHIRAFQKQHAAQLKATKV